MGIFTYLTGKNNTEQNTAVRDVYVPTVKRTRPLSCPCAAYGIPVGHLQNAPNQAPLLFAQTYIKPNSNIFGGIPIFYEKQLQGTLPGSSGS